jgi:hypothetical protein
LQVAITLFFGLRQIFLRQIFIQTGARIARSPGLSHLH